MFSLNLSIVALLLGQLYKIHALLPDQGICGSTSIEPSISFLSNDNDNFSLSRIINGIDAVSNSWPWQVSLRLYQPALNLISSNFCGGNNFYL